MTRSSAISALPGRILNFISSRDHRLMRRVHRWRAPRWVRVVMVCASRAGDGWLWLSVGLALMTQDRPGPAAICAASLAAGVGLGIYFVVKQATGRKRPCLIEPHCWARVLPPDQYSSPLRAHDHGVLHRDGRRSVLSLAHVGSSVCRCIDRGFAHRAGNAFSQ